ncbi:MAG: PsbP-related protein [Patescibacteria group bacterium]
MTTKGFNAVIGVIVVLVLGIGVAVSYYVYYQSTEVEVNTVDTNTTVNQNTNTSLPAGTKTCKHNFDCEVKYDCEQYDCYHKDAPPEFKCDPTLVDVPSSSNYYCVCAEKECALVEEDDVTADWQTYASEDYGYSIKYPNDWLTNMEYINQSNLYLLTQERKQDLDDGRIVRVFDVMVKVYGTAVELPHNSDDQLNFENWIDQKADTWGFINRESVLIDGITGYQGIGSGDGTSYISYIEKDGYIYEIQTGDTDVPTETEQLVIDSFQFTD